MRACLRACVHGALLRYFPFWRSDAQRPLSLAVHAHPLAPCNTSAERGATDALNVAARTHARMLAGRAAAPTTPGSDEALTLVSKWMDAVSSEDKDALARLLGNGTAGAKVREVRVCLPTHPRSLAASNGPPDPVGACRSRIGPSWPRMDAVASQAGQQGRPALPACSGELCGPQPLNDIGGGT